MQTSYVGDQSLIDTLAMPRPRTELSVRVHGPSDLAAVMPALEDYVLRGGGTMPLSRHPAWLLVLRDGLGHVPYCIEAAEAESTRGILPLLLVRSLLFGRFLVSMPYLNYGGVSADDAPTAARLVDRAVELANELGVRYLELRQEAAIDHEKLSEKMTDKVHMRLPLPAASETLWKALPAKVRNQVRKGQKSGLAVAWGGQELLREFHAVFSENMRDLGTPCFGRRLFASILKRFEDQAEVCVVRADGIAVASAVLLHGPGVTEVPSASSLRRYNSTCANMLMYWHLLERATERRQQVFDFGRSSRDGSTYRFKEQWGAQPAAAAWQYFVRVGKPCDMRPDSPRYQRLIRIWQRLPVAVTRWLGPAIVRGIP